MTNADNQNLILLSEKLSSLFPKRSRYIDRLDKDFPKDLHKENRIFLYHPLPVSEEHSEDWHTVQMAQRMLMLFEHFNIKPNESDSFALLAMALAEKHIPAFEIDSLSDETSRKKWEAFEFYLEIRWIKLKKNLDTVKGSIELWLSLRNMNVEANIASKSTAYNEIRKNNRILVALRNSLNPKARGQAHDFITTVKDIPDEELDNHLFRAFSKALNPIRQLLKSTKKL